MEKAIEIMDNFLRPPGSFSETRKKFIYTIKYYSNDKVWYVVIDDYATNNQWVGESYISVEDAAKSAISNYELNQ